jgi:hypothetical protein
MLVDLSTTDLVYPSSCVASSRAFVKAEPKLVEDFFARLYRRNSADQRRPKLRGEISRQMVKRKRSGSGQADGRRLLPAFKQAPYVPDKGVENVLRELANRRSIPEEFDGRPEIFRDHGPLERALRAKK